ncbi:hypothetical protein [Pseudomonas sp. S2_A02]
MAPGVVGEGRFQVGVRVYRALAEEVFFFVCFGWFLTVRSGCSRGYGLLLCCKPGGAGLSGKEKGFCGRDCLQFLAENVLEMGCSKNNHKWVFLLHVVVLVDF